MSHMPLFAIVLAALASTPAVASPALERADAYWARRAEGQVAGRAQPEPIGSAVAAYREALRAEPDRLETHWKLQRALWFAADFATGDPAVERRLYDEAIAVGEDAFRVLGLLLGGRARLDGADAAAFGAELSAAERSDAAHFYFWHAVNLGAWARLAGVLEAVRAGVAGRMHAATVRSIALDPGVEQGGGIRLLSRLHAQVPRVPLLSGWVDHDRAIPLAEQAAAEYPEHPGNDFLLGLTLLERAPDRRAEAIALLERTAAIEPRGDHVVEDVAIRSTAQEELDRARRTAEADAPPA